MFSRITLDDRAAKCATATTIGSEHFSQQFDVEVNQALQAQQCVCAMAVLTLTAAKGVCT